MATPPRFFESGTYYHVYNRGNRKQQIFLSDRDYERFLGKVLEYKKKFLINILAFCLMPNHFHFLLQQLTLNAISRFFSDLCNSHSRYFNVKYETVGSLFQGRFKAKRVDKDEYLIHLSRYIHLNPAELFYPLGEDVVDKFFRYKWSSLPYYLRGESNDLVDTRVVLAYFSKEDPVLDYKDFVTSNIHLRVDPIVSHLVFDE